MHCVSHRTFGLDFAEMLVCRSCSAISDVQNSHLDFFMTLYATELIELQKNKKGTQSFEQLMRMMHFNESQL